MGIQKIGPQRYRVFADLGRGPDGRRRRHTEVVRGSKREAEARERELLQARRTGTYIEPSKVTVAAYMRSWLRSVEQKVYWNTYRGYEQRTRTHIVPDLGTVRLQDLSPVHIEEAEQHWLAHGNRRNGGGLDPRTVHHIHTVLHAAMERAVKWKLIPLNPVDSVDPPHVPRKEQAFLTAEESERVVQALDDDPYELPILVGLYCALRPAEYLALRWRDVDLKVGELRVTQNVHRVRQDQVTEHMGCKVAGFRFGPAKTHRSMRPVSMPKVMVDLLADWKRAQAAQRLQAGPSWADLDLVFTDPRGYPYNHDRVRRSFYRALTAAEVRQVVLYALRHTSATLTLADSKDLKLVASRLGHANQHLVLDTYGHLLPGADREAADRLGEIVKRRPRNNGSAEEACDGQGES